MVVGVCDQNHIFLRDKVHTQRMLQLGVSSNTVTVSKTVQIAGILIAANQVARARQALHVDRSN